MSLVGGCQASSQMYHHHVLLQQQQQQPRDFSVYHHQPPSSSIPPSSQPPHHHHQQHHQQQQHEQQRYLPSMETLSAAAAAAAASSSLHSSAINPSPPSASDNSSIAYFQNLMFNSQYPAASAGPSDYACALQSSSSSSSAAAGGTDPLTLCSPDAVHVVYPHSTPTNLYMNYDELPLLLPVTGNGVDDGTGVPRVRTVKRRVSSNRKERRRTHSINTAFAALRGCIPNVPSDTKLSKIKTLRLATSYIAYLMDILNKDDPKLAEGGFKADISRKIESREEKRKRESEEILKAISAHGECEKPSRGRTGWPQQVWAAELKQ